MNRASASIREQILAMLTASPGVYLSGEALSNDLEMTRAAVWKHMQALQTEGWPLERQTRMGYRIPKGAAWPFSAAGIMAELRVLERNAQQVPEDGITREDWLSWSPQVLDEVNSTNTRLKELAAAGAPEGTVVFAESQTDGRGRMGRQWASVPGGGIWMSILLRPRMKPGQVQALTLAASVAVMEAIRNATGDQPEALAGMGIKWPNDILVNGKKLCGILTELAAEMERVNHVVIGIGLNVAQGASDFPPELSEVATSLKQCLPVDAVLPDRNRLAAHLLHSLAQVYQQHRMGDMEGVLTRWRKDSLTLGHVVRVMDPNEPWQARAVDVALDGRLLLEKEDGTKVQLLSGEISIR